MTGSLVQQRTIVCFGDSVTQGIPHVAPEDTFPALLQRRLNMRFAGEYSFDVVNAGVGGENSAEGLARIETDVLAHNPALVIIEFGLNDIRYEPEKKLEKQQFAANLEKMHAILNEKNIRTIFTTPNPIIDEYHGYSKGIDYYKQWGGCNGACAAYAEVVREVTSRLQAPLVDIYDIFVQKAWEAEFKGETFDAADLSILRTLISSHDGVHPTAAGQQLIAMELYKSIVRGKLYA